MCAHENAALEKASAARIMRRGGQKRSFEPAMEHSVAAEDELAEKLTILRETWASPRIGCACRLASQTATATTLIASPADCRLFSIADMIWQLLSGGQS